MLMQLEARGRLKFQFYIISNNKEENMWNFEVWALLLTVYTLRATGSWMNVKIYLVCIVI